MKKSMPKVKDRNILEEIGRDLLAKIMATANEKNLLFSEPMIMIPVKYDDGSFKNKPTAAGWEFFVEYVYVGSRGDLIFGFSSPDRETVPGEGVKSWASAEFTLKKLDDAFPLLLQELTTLCAPTSHSAIKSMDDLVAHLYDKKAMVEAMEMETAEEKLKANPMFGLF